MRCSRATLARAVGLLAGTSLVLALAAAAGAGTEPGPLALSDLDGSPVELALGPNDAALVVHFWATWCPSCVGELPVLDAAVRACPTPVLVVAVNVAEGPETIRSFLAGLPGPHPLALRQLRDATGDVWRRVSGHGLPVNLVWTRTGARVEPGPRDAASWTRLLEALGCG